MRPQAYATVAPGARALGHPRTRSTLGRHPRGAGSASGTLRKRHKHLVKLITFSLSFTLQHTSQHTVAQAYTPKPHYFPPHRISRCMLPPHCTQPQNTCFYFLYSSFTTLQTPANTSEHTDWVKAIVLPYLGCPPN